MDFIITQLKNNPFSNQIQKIKRMTLIDLFILIYQHENKLKSCILFEISQILVHLLMVGKLV